MGFLQLKPRNMPEPPKSTASGSFSLSWQHILSLREFTKFPSILSVYGSRRICSREAELHFCLRHPLVSPDLGGSPPCNLSDRMGPRSVIPSALVQCFLVGRTAKRTSKPLSTADTTNPKITLVSFLSNLPHFSYTFISGLVDINVNLYCC